MFNVRSIVHQSKAFWCFSLSAIAYTIFLSKVYLALACVYELAYIEHMKAKTAITRKLAEIESATALFDELMRRQRAALVAAGYTELDNLDHDYSEAENEAMDAICTPIMAEYPENVGLVRYDLEDELLTLAREDAMAEAMQYGQSPAMVRSVFDAAISREHMAVRNKTLRLVREMFAPETISVGA